MFELHKNTSILYFYYFELKHIFRIAQWLHKGTIIAININRHLQMNEAEVVVGNSYRLYICITTT